MGDVDQLRHTRERYYTSPMSMGKPKRDRQPAMWVTTTDLPTAASHPFYRRLNQLLREYGFDDFVEAPCAGFYAETMGRPGLPPGIYFRLLLIGYFETSVLEEMSCPRVRQLVPRAVDLTNVVHSGTQVSLLGPK